MPEPERSIEYEIQLKKLITNTIKRFQQGQDPKEVDLTLDLVYLTMVHEVKMLVKMVYENVAKTNRKEIIKMVTNADGQCIWEVKSWMMMVTMSRSRKKKGYLHHWTGVNMIQSLDMTLDAHQIDKIVMLLQCHSEMLECQAMVLKMLSWENLWTW